MTSAAAASRYARALFDVLLKEGGDLEKAETDLASFAGLLTQHPVLATTLRNPAIPVSKKKGIVQGILDRDASVSLIDQTFATPTRNTDPGRLIGYGYFLRWPAIKAAMRAELRR